MVTYLFNANTPLNELTNNTTALISTGHTVKRTLKYLDEKPIKPGNLDNSKNIVPIDCPVNR